MSQAGILDDSGGSIDPSIPTQFNGNPGGGFAVPAFNQLNVVGDNTQGINVTGAGSTLTIAGINAAYTQKGVASFDPGDFTVTNGNVVLNGSGVGQTITGNIGVPISPVAGNWNLVTANSTPRFVGTAGTQTLDFSLTNLVLGTSLPSLTTGLRNVGVGFNVFNALTAAVDNCAFGSGALQAVSDGDSNSCFGSAAGASITTGDANQAFGRNALLALTTGFRNCATGFGSLGNCNSSDNCAYGHLSGLGLTSGQFCTAYGSLSQQTCSTGSNNTSIGYGSFATGLGSNNTCLGYNSGTGYLGSESSNVLINHIGVTADANAIRIGTPGGGAGQQNKAFVAGITGVTVAASAPVAVDTNGQLSSLGFGTATQILTSNGAGVSPTWQAAPAAGVASVTAGANINLTGTSSNPIVNLNTQVLQPDGTVGAPPYSFTLHTDSGMYWDGRLSFSAGGTKVLYFDAFNWASDASNNTFNGGVNINGYFAPNYTNPGGYPYTVLSSDYYISVDSSGGARTINFPNAPRTNVQYVVKDRTGNAAANNITLTTPAGTILFDGSATYVINVNFGSVSLKFNGTNFEVF